MTFKLILVFCLCLGFALAKHEFYDGYALYQVEVNDVEQAQLVKEIQSDLDLDVWSHALPGRPGLVLVSKDLKENFQNALIKAGIKYQINTQNIKDQLEQEDDLLAAAARNNNGTRSSLGGLSFDTIHRYEVVDAYLVELAQRYHETVKVESAGRSFEGRDIKYIKISTTNFQDSNKPVVMIESLLHCREWVGLSATLYAIQKLVIDITERDLLQDIDWIILPIANPDGYEWTHTDYRFWRKNRSTGYVIGNLCMGVDLNRNFDIHWGTASSASVCSDTFHGRAPFSEPEVTNIKNIIEEHSDRLALYLDIHSFGSMILYGYGNGQLPPNGLSVHVAGILMAQNIDRVKISSNPNYIVGNVQAVLYAASGSSTDYAQSVTGSYAYTFELPAYRNQQNSLNGFLVDPNFIEQAGFETWEGIKEGARYVANNYKMQKQLKL